MPTYDYICDACGHEFEAFESIKADPQKTCPACAADQLRRKLGPGAAILFKGSGFYQTDYRSESYKQAAKADKSGETSGGGNNSESGKGGDSNKGGESGGTSPKSEAPKSTPSPSPKPSGGGSDG